MKKITLLFTKYPWLKIVLLFCVWRTILQIVVWWGDVRFPDANYPYPVAVWGNHILRFFAKWDSIYYHDIIRQGYRGDILEFFPLFPLLAKGINYIIGNHQLLAAAIVVNLAALGSCLILYKLAKLDEKDENLAQRAVFFLLIFPAAFFLIAHYTESLFLFLSLLSFYFARQKRWWQVGIFGAFAVLTRTTGILLLPALLVELILQNWHKIRPKINWKALIPLALIPLGLAAFIGYAKIEFNRPWAFIEIQKAFGRKLELNTFKTVREQCLSQLIVRDPHHYFTEDATNAFNYLMFWSVFLVLVILLCRYSRPSYAVLGICSFIIPATSGTFISMNRFLLVLFPIYLLLAKLIPPNSLIERIYTIASLSLMILIMLLFTNNYWVG